MFVIPHKIQKYFNTHSLTGVIRVVLQCDTTAEFQYTLPYGSDSATKDALGFCVFQYTLPYGSDSVFQLGCLAENFNTHSLTGVIQNLLL